MNVVIYISSIDSKSRSISTHVSLPRYMSSTRQDQQNNVTGKTELLSKIKLGQDLFSSNPKLRNDFYSKAQLLEQIFCLRRHREPVFEDEFMNGTTPPHLYYLPETDFGRVFRISSLFEYSILNRDVILPVIMGRGALVIHRHRCTPNVK